MKTVVYHSADFDGIFCREIARKFLAHDENCDTQDNNPDGACKPCNCIKYIGWNFGDPKIPFPDEGDAYVMDLSPDCFTDMPQQTASSLIWIDHHKTSIDKWPSHLLGYRIDGVAACRLAWQWFLWSPDPLNYWTKYSGDPPRPRLPLKQDFIDRNVREPLAVRLAGEYDVWDKRDPDAETFQYGLRVQGGSVNWNGLLGGDIQQNAWADKYVLDGLVAQKYAQNVDASICNSLTWLMEWEGLKWLCVNHARFNSLLFAAKDMPETDHDALLGFRFDGKTWMVSLYHARHRTDLDLSPIATKYGGGGHRGACGFTCRQLPFQLA